MLWVSKPLHPAYLELESVARTLCFNSIHLRETSRGFRSTQLKLLDPLAHRAAATFSCTDGQAKANQFALQ